MNHERFDSQVAVVTGAAQGLGASIARLLAARGAFVHLLDMDREKLDQVAGEVAPMARGHLTDLTRESEILQARERILADSRSIQVLINNAGIYPFEGIKDITEASWDRMFNTNVRSVFFVTRAFMDA